MLDKKEFLEIRKDIDQFEDKREEVIKSSREIIKLSKLIIYEIHRGNIKEAEKLSKDIRKKTNRLLKGDYDAAINRVALCEYVEALSFLGFVNNKRIPTRKELEVDTEAYLCGLCDLTGELTRKAIDAIIKRNMQQAMEVRDLVNSLYGEFLNFNLRNGELRKKSDSIKWNLRKIEEALFAAENNRINQ